LTEKYDEESRLREQLDLLVESLESDSPSVRNAVVVQLAMFGSKAVPHLINVLGSDLAEELRARRAGEAKNSYLVFAIDGILKTLGIISDPSTVDVIGRALPRKESVEALAKIGGPRPLEMIIGLIAAPADSLGNQKGGPLRNFVDEEQGSSPQNERFVRSVFTFLGEPGKARLKQELASPDVNRRAAAASVARIMHERDFIPELTAILKGREFSAKAEAAHALIEVGATDAGPLLEKELFEIEARIEDLEQSQSKEVSDLLVYSQMQEARDVIEKAILELGDADALVEVGFHPPKHDRKFAVRPGFRIAIVKKGESAMPALTKFLTAQDRAAQGAAADIIAEIKKS
jgi:HEAT repeat protein